MIDLCVSGITGGKHNPTLSIKLDNEAATVFALEFIKRFGNLVNTENRIKVQAIFISVAFPVLHDFRGKCCVTGLNIPQTLHASHIVAWASDKTNSMNPENVLCLSATYDAAFDKHII